MAQTILIIDGWTVPKLIDYKIEYNKLWSSDSGRDMLGDNKGSLIGIYPKLYVKVGSWSQSQMQTFLGKVNKNHFSIRYFDTERNSLVTGSSYYVNDYTIEMKSSKHMTYKGFEFNLIPNRKR